MGDSERWLLMVISHHSSLLWLDLSYGHSTLISQPSHVKTKTMQGILKRSG